MDNEIKRGPGRPRIIPAPGEGMGQEEPMRPDMRPDMRPEMRDLDPQAAARKLAQEIMAQIGDSVDEAYEFFVEDEIKDPYWDYQWVRHFTYEKEDTNNINRYLRTGWEYVPANTPGFERFIPKGWKENFILKDGMGLMKRPKEISAMFNDRNKKEAKQRLRIAEQPLRSLPDGFSTENGGRGQISVNGVAGVRRTISGPIPN